MTRLRRGARWLAAPLALGLTLSLTYAVDMPNTPLGSQAAVAPMVMLVAAKDHRFFYEAYNDASDLDGDGTLDTRFKPTYTYYGLFDSTLCYSHAGTDTNTGLFTPSGLATSGKCTGAWSGNWLNYVTTSRMDAVRKVLYGGYREVDTSTSTILRRAYIPQDAHSWAKEYTSATVDGYNITDYTPLAQPASGKRHFFGNLTRNKSTNCATLSSCSGMPPLMSVVTNTGLRVWEWASTERPVLDTGNHGGTRSDYTVRVEVCTSTYHANGCKQYLGGNYKPFGILHEYGESGSILFGLITGSYDQNMSGGRLRKAVSNFANEVDVNTGVFTSSASIVSAFNALRIRDYNNGGTGQSYRSGWVTTRAMNEGEFYDWGAPLGEMMYEALRYYSGKKVATSAFSGSSTVDAAMGLTSATWDDPYDTVNSAAKAPRCSRPNVLTLSDINVSFDSDQVPGSYFGSFSGDLSGLNVQTEAATLTANEPGVAGQHFIGQSGTNSDSVPSAKTVTSLGNIRGLAPEEPTKQGSYYSASVAYWGKRNDLRSDLGGAQSVDTFSLVLASPLPRIEAPLPNGKVVTLVPLAKSVGGGPSNAKGSFQPTNQIVDFYVDSIVNSGTADRDTSVNGGRYQAKFRINFEDVEQGADHDMDAITEYLVQAQADNTLKVTLTPVYQAGSIQHRMGYVISGTTADGAYLVVQDEGDERPYFMNVPDGRALGYCDTSDLLTNPPSGCSRLPYLGGTVSSSVRTFTPGTGSAATLMKDPLWYAAKWGGFKDSNGDNKPDLTAEWDADSDGVPDTYFFAQDPSALASSLRRAFEDLKNRNTSASDVAVNSSSVTSNTMAFQATYNAVNWSGNLIAYPITANGVSTNPVWNVGANLPAWGSRNIYFRNASGNTTKAFSWANLTTTEKGYFSNYSYLLDYTRGDRSREVNNGGVLRNRGTYPMGDIVHSSPYFSSELNTVFVGANDGMLHAFNADTGVEVMAYVPAALLPSVAGVSSVSYQHKHLMDGHITVGDKSSLTNSRNYLYAMLGRGGKGLMSLNVTDTASMGSGSGLWEYTPTGSSTAASDADLGYMLGKPHFVKLNTGGMAVIAGNGYNSTNGKAVLYIFQIAANGNLSAVRKLDTGVAGDNGLGSPVVQDIDEDGDIDYVFAGDLKGNVWKFDLTSSTRSQWKVAFSGSPLFRAVDSSGTAQPITAPLSVIVNDQAGDPNLGKTFVFFGTGSYFRTGDPADTSIQTWYGVIDGTTSIASRTDLRARTISQRGTSGGLEVRTFSAATTDDMVGKRGWYIDFVGSTGVGEGERFVSTTQYYRLVEPVVVASSIIPVSTTDVCAAGGTGYLNVVNAFTGAATSNGVLDTTDDNSFEDDVLGDTYIGSVNLGIGMLSEPILVGNYLVVGGAGTDTSDASIGDMRVNLGGTPYRGRIGWREIILD